MISLLFEMNLSPWSYLSTPTADTFKPFFQLVPVIINGTFHPAKLAGNLRLVSTTCQLNYVTAINTFKLLLRDFIRCHLIIASSEC